jgi:C_GCAxxG_C_C family probable redox protein
VFSSFAPALGIGVTESLKITSGFGAGICYKGEICGAVSGAYMALGLKYGRWQSEDAEAKEKTYALMREFDGQFIARNGSLYCNKLLEGDMSTPEGRKQINDAHRFKTHCPRFVKDAAEIAKKLIES